MHGKVALVLHVKLNQYNYWFGLEFVEPYILRGMDRVDGWDGLSAGRRRQASFLFTDSTSRQSPYHEACHQTTIRNV